MAAAAFSFGLFLFFAVVGMGVTALLRAERRANDFLIGPAIGVACVAIPSVALSRLGFPADHYGPVLALVLLGIGGYGVFRSRRQYDWRALLPFALMIACSFLLTGWPLFKFTFHWLSYANDDMANYANLAQRLVQHGYYQAPSLKAFGTNQNFPMFYWFLDDVGNERYGVDAVLAWATSLVRLNAFECFMPTIVALHLCVVAAASGLVYRSEKYRPAALLTCLLVACSSLLSFGVDYQLIAQSAGLALVCASMALVTSLPIDRPISFRQSFGQIALSVIALAGMSEVYPEVIPFVVGPAVFYVIYRGVRRNVHFASAGAFAVMLAAGWALLLNGYLRNFTWVLLSRVIATNSVHQRADFPLLFPFYLIPTGFANYFGAYPLTIYPAEPWLSLGIAAGMVLAGVSTYAVVRGIVRGEPVAFVTLVAEILAAYLFYKVADFGLYKIAMYSQPFLLGTLGIWWCDIWKNRVSLSPRLSRALMLAESKAT